MSSIKPTAILGLLVLAGLLFGCGGEVAGDARSPVPERGKPPDTVRVVCAGDGAHVLTPKVEARPDGVHLAIDNRLRGDADLSVDHPGGGMGWSVPTGESKRVANVPPGKMRIDCYGRSWGKARLFAMDSGMVKVLAGDSGYKSPKLDCRRGKPVGGMRRYTEEEMGAREGKPTELLRRELSGSLRRDDVVEIAGNARNRGEKTVRVVRRGKVIANAHYIRVSDGWLGGLTENCAGL